MVDTPNPNSFENLTQSGIMKIPSKDDRNISLSLDVYGGNTSFCIFTAPGARPWKLTLPRKTISNIVILLKKIAAAPQTCREFIGLNKFEEGDGKKGFKSYGQIGFGIDETMVFYIDVAANDLQGRHMFTVKPDGRFDFSNTTMSEKDHLIASIHWVIQSFESASVMAERMTSFKRTNTGGRSFGGGNKSSGGSYGNQNNYSKGGQNSQPKNDGGTFSGAPDSDNDLYI